MACSSPRDVALHVRVRLPPQRRPVHAPGYKTTTRCWFTQAHQGAAESGSWATVECTSQAALQSFIQTRIFQFSYGLYANPTFP